MWRINSPISSGNVHLTRLSPSAGALPSTCPFCPPFFIFPFQFPPQSRRSNCAFVGRVDKHALPANVLGNLNSCPNSFLFNLHGNAALSSSCPTLFFKTNYQSPFHEVKARCVQGGGIEKHVNLVTCAWPVLRVWECSTLHVVAPEVPSGPRSCFNPNYSQLL